MVVQRSVYIDYVRLFVIILVVMIHAAVTYSGIGSWYYMDVTAHSMVDILPFLFFQSFTQSFSMGLLFLVGGYMVPPALDKKGPAGFLRDRLYRLGLPTLFYMLVINPFIQYFLVGEAKQPFMNYFETYYLSGRFVGASGPLWFALALLIFSFLYAAAQGYSIFANQRNRSSPFAMEDMVKLSLLITICAFLIRLVQPIDTSILNMQLCFFAQYVVFFIIGTTAAREKLLDRVDYRLGLRCLQIALIPGVLLWWAMMFVICGGFSANNFDAIKGGFQWQSFAYAFWESTNSVLMSFGLLTVFRERLNMQNRFFMKLSNCSFAVYVFHAPILVIVSKFFAPMGISQGGKFFGVSAIALVLSFGLSHYVFNRIPMFNTNPSAGSPKKSV